jgi:hypothetical protein
MINAAADKGAVGELRPISGPLHARIAGTYMKHAVRIAAKRLSPQVGVHGVADAPPA